MPSDDPTETPIPVITENSNTADKKVEKDKKDKAEELSEEDAALKEGLELAVQRLMEDEVPLHKPALLHLSNEIKSATSSMTSVPKPLKFLRPHYESLKVVYNRWEETHEMKPLLADVLSVLAMTMAPAGSRECLKFKLLGTSTDCSAWGHEYVRSLAGEISEEYNAQSSVAELELAEEEYMISEELMTLVEDIVPFQMHHNAEAEAMDLLMEIRQLNKLIDSPVVDERNFERVCLYLLRSVDYVYDPEDLATLYQVTFHIYQTQRRFSDALRVALKMDDEKKVLSLFALSGEDGPSAVEKQQMALILGRHRSHITLNDPSLDPLVGNHLLSSQFRHVARSMDLAKAKSAEDIVGGPSSARKNKAASDPFAALFNRDANSNGTESARGNLALSLINAFVNAGHDSDMYMHNTLMDEANNDTSASSKEGVTTQSVLTDWLSRNKGSGLSVAAASLGLVSMWNVEEGLNRVDPLLYHSDVNVKAGAVLAIGIMNCGVNDEADAALALLSDYLVDDNAPTAVRQAAILGLGICYAGTRKVEVKDVLEGVVNNSEATSIGAFAEAALASTALGLVFAGTADDEVGSTILQRLMETPNTDLDQPLSRLLVLGLGLLFLNKGELADPFLEALQTIEHRRGQFATTVLESCAYAATGNVLKVQEMLRLCAEHAPLALPANTGSSGSAGASSGPGGAMAGLAGLLSPGGGGGGGGAAAPTNATTAASEGKEDPALLEQSVALGERQGAAVLGIALVALGEEVGSEMSLRSFDHLLQYGDLAVRRSVPLALALLHLSNPDYTIVDQLSRLSHDVDLDTAMAAILGLGIISAGTNNSRVANLLRQLAEFYAKDAQVLLVVRMAQGLNSLGKGLLTLSPFHSDRLLLQTPGLAAILVVLHLALDLTHTLLDSNSSSSQVGGQPQWLFVLAAAMSPRYLHTVTSTSSSSTSDEVQLETQTVSVRVGLAVETVGQAGRPKTITGFQTHTTPVLLGAKDRAELASRDFRAVTGTVEGVVIVEKVEEKEL
jgi:26S proteasome regulatory subunit N1